MKIFELKVLKEELERISKDLELQSRGTHTTPTSSMNANIANIWSHPDVHSTIKPPKLEITPFEYTKMARILGCL